MSEYAGIRLSWERVIAAAKNLPDPASVSQEMQVEQDNNRQERYLLFALENIFTITSQAIGYTAFMATMIQELSHDCPVSMAFLRHVVDKSELPDGQTLETVSRMILEKSCINGYILWILLARKFAGHLTESLWSDKVYEHLIKVIQSESDAKRLYALLALESFAMTGNIKRYIMQRDIQHTLNCILLDCNSALESTPSPLHMTPSKRGPSSRRPRSINLSVLLLPFMKKKKIPIMTVMHKSTCQKKQSRLSHTTLAHCTDQCHVLYQTKYCVQWSLRHVFTDDKNRAPFAEPKLIAHHDLYEFRNDNPFLLQTIRSTTMMTNRTGVWYYEVMLITSGVVHVGWASPSSQFIPEQGYGVGDNMNGFAFDSYRGVLWTSGKAVYPDDNPIVCHAGDVIGTLLNLKKGYCSFFVNGQEIELSIELTSATQMFPAVSLTSHQQIAINYGDRPWFCPPPMKATPVCSLYKERQVNHQDISDNDDLLCILCYAEPRDTTLYPCLHEQFGQSCVKNLKTCPLCRVEIYKKKKK
ncbi:unnamed protein product [Rhizopus microsporus]